MRRMTTYLHSGCALLHHSDNAETTPRWIHGYTLHTTYNRHWNSWHSPTASVHTYWTASRCLARLGRRLSTWPTTAVVSDRSQRSLQSADVLTCVMPRTLSSYGVSHHLLAILQPAVNCELIKLKPANQPWTVWLQLSASMYSTNTQVFLFNQSSFPNLLETGWNGAKALAPTRETTHQNSPFPNPQSDYWEKACWTFHTGSTMPV